METHLPNKFLCAMGLLNWTKPAGSFCTAKRNIFTGKQVKNMNYFLSLFLFLD